MFYIIKNSMNDVPTFEIYNEEQFYSKFIALSYSSILYIADSYSLNEFANNKMPIFSFEGYECNTYTLSYIFDTILWNSNEITLSENMFNNDKRLNKLIEYSKQNNYNSLEITEIVKKSIFGKIIKNYHIKQKGPILKQSDKKVKVTASSFLVYEYCNKKSTIL